MRVATLPQPSEDGRLAHKRSSLGAVLFFIWIRTLTRRPRPHGHGETVGMGVAGGGARHLVRVVSNRRAREILERAKELG